MAISLSLFERQTTQIVENHHGNSPVSSKTPDKDEKLRPPSRNKHA